MGYKIQLILMPAVAFFITTTNRSLILVVGVQLFAPDEDTVNVSVSVPCPAGISITEENTP
ncbi:hypothetical protein AMK86_27935 [Escherichia coli]|nr:hypothetical protein AMK86_27935 [Escherichia coli]